MSTHEPVGEQQRLAALRTLALIDLTSLGENDVPADIDALCDGATSPFGEVTAVCVWPRFVFQAVGPDVGLKVILETGELVEEELIRSAALHALDAGADFLKTSTGKTAQLATPEAATVLLDVLASYQGEAGIKMSGGVRTVDQAMVCLDLADRLMGPDWTTKNTFRFEASSLLGDVLAALAI